MSAPALRLVKDDLPVYVSAALDDAGMDPSAFRVFVRICRRWSDERGCFESIGEMARACRMHPKTVASALRRLERWGVVRRTERRGTTDRFDPLPQAAWHIGEAEDSPQSDTPPSPQSDTPPSPQKYTPPSPQKYTPPSPQKYTPPLPPKLSYEGNPFKGTQEEGGRTPPIAASSSPAPVSPVTAPPAQPAPVSAAGATHRVVRGAAGDPVAIYTSVTRRPCPLFFQEKIRAVVGHSPRRVALWEAICTTWTTTDGWNEGQVLKMLDDFAKQAPGAMRTTSPSDRSALQAARPLSHWF